MSYFLYFKVWQHLQELFPIKEGVKKAKTEQFDKLYMQLQHQQQLLLLFLQ